MDWSLNLAVVVFSVALVTAVGIGIWMTWAGSPDMNVMLWRIFMSSLLILLGAGSYIALRDALHRIRAAQ